MISSTRGPAILGVAAIFAAASLAGCATFAKWKQEHHAAVVHREQIEQSSANNTGSKADRAAKAKLVQHDANLRRLQSELAARSDADSLAASALFARVIDGFSGSRSLDLAARAAAAAPDRAYLTFVQLQLCQSAPNCDTEPLEARLLQLDPDNGVAWTYELLRADQANSAVGWKAGLAGLAQSKRVVIYWNDIVSHLTAAAAGKAGFDTSAAMIEVIGIEAAFMSPLQPVSKGCSLQEIEQPAALAQCRQIAAAFRHGDTVLYEGYGSGLAARLWAAGSAEGQQIAAETRALHYRMDLMTRNSAKLDSPQATRALAALYGKYPTEQTAFRAWYVDMGLQPDPPATWQDRSPGG